MHLTIQFAKAPTHSSHQSELEALQRVKPGWKMMMLKKTQLFLSLERELGLKVRRLCPPLSLVSWTLQILAGECSWKCLMVAAGLEPGFASTLGA